MRRRLMLLTCMVAIGSWTAATFAGGPNCGGCNGCDKVKAEGKGYCCGKGKVFGLEVTNKTIYDLLAGNEEMAKKVESSPCPGCRKAVSENGSCEHCNVFVADGRVYKSKAANQLASGKPMCSEKAKSIKCGSCLEACPPKFNAVECLSGQK